MPYCQKCGTKVDEVMSFCPNCGAALKFEQPSVAPAPMPQVPPATQPPYKEEKREKQEKQEKNEPREKTEKHEKKENGYIGPLVGGLILIVLGLILYLELTSGIQSGVLWAFFFVVIGIVIIVGAVYAAMMASKRQPRV